MNLIKDWLLAISVCRKYNISWNPFFGLKSAQCVYNFDTQRKKVMVNPFYPKFIDSFMHEVGHLLRWDKLYKACAGGPMMKVSNFKDQTSCILKEEYIAWKFSKRFLKGRFDKNRAKERFKTYYKQSSREIGALKAVDRYYAYDRNI